MAQKIQTIFIDDIDGTEDAENTVTFAIDGADYEIDLNAKNTSDLRGIFAPYVAAARRATSTGARSIGRARSAGASKAARTEELTEARAWLRANGYEGEVKDRGRISESLMTAYRNQTPAVRPVTDDEIKAGITATEPKAAEETASTETAETPKRSRRRNLAPVPEAPVMK